MGDSVIFFFFFFQAEDGIRDWSVTGVQTCALPISWYAEQRDLPEPPWGATALYQSVEELRLRFAPEIRAADLVVVGSYVPEGMAVAECALDTTSGVVAFWDIDTPITVAKLEAGDEEYL